MGRIYPDTLDSMEEKLEFCEDYWQIYSVTDGIGGAGIGDISSRFVQGVLCECRKSFPQLDPLNFSFAPYIQAFTDEADSGLQDRLTRYAELPVGCSLALIMLAGEQCFTMSIGSCRIYLIRSGRLYQMTRDHCLEEDSGSRPLLFFGNHPGSIHLMAQNLTRMTIQPEDRFLIMSDGMLDALLDEDIIRIMNRPDSFQQQINSLFRTARRFDARDNQTVMGLRIESRMAFSEPYASYEKEQRSYRDHVIPQETTSEEGATVRFRTLGTRRFSLPGQYGEGNKESAYATIRGIEHFVIPQTESPENLSWREATGEHQAYAAQETEPDMIPKEEQSELYFPGQKPRPGFWRANLGSILLFVLLIILILVIIFFL